MHARQSIRTPLERGPLVPLSQNLGRPTTSSSFNADGNAGQQCKEAPQTVYFSYHVSFYIGRHVLPLRNSQVTCSLGVPLFSCWYQGAISLLSPQHYTPQSVSTNTLEPTASAQYCRDRKTSRLLLAISVPPDCEHAASGLHAGFPRLPRSPYPPRTHPSMTAG